MIGYQRIKLKKSTSEVTGTNTPLLYPVYIRAKFLLFKPQVGSELRCVVDKRVDGLVTCLAHGVFKVDVVEELALAKGQKHGSLITNGVK